MKKSLALFLSLGIIALAPLASLAIGGSEVLISMQTAREKLVALLDTSDKAMQATLIDSIHKASDEADKKLAAALGDAALTAEVKAKLTEAKSTWEDFKKTREADIIPAVQAGNAAKGKELAKTVQADRFKKLVTLLQ